MKKDTKPNTIQAEIDISKEECCDIISFLLEKADFSESSAEYKSKVFSFLHKLIGGLKG